MIVRVFSENQYRLPESSRERLHELDAEYIAAVQDGDEAQFHDAYGALLGLIRSEGTVLGDEELEPSDFMLPPADVTLEEVRKDFTGEGLIPD